MATIIFDLDGVLIRSRNPDKSFIWQSTAADDIGVSHELIAQIFSIDDWMDILRGNLDARKKIASAFQENKISLSIDTFIDYWLSHDLNWRFDILELAHDLAKDHNLHIATNQDKIRASYIRSKPEVTGVFKSMIASSDVGSVKPEEAFFEGVNKIITPAHPVIFVDDNTKNAYGCKCAEWQGIHFDPDLRPQDTADVLKTKITGILSCKL